MSLRLGIHGKLLALSLGAGILPLAALGAGSYYLASQTLTQATQRSLRVLNVNVADKINRFLFEREGDVVAFALCPVFVEGAGPARQSAYLRHMQAVYRTYPWIGFANPQGTVIAATDPTTIGQEVGHEVWFQRGLAGHFHGAVHRSPRAGNQPVLPFSAVVKGASGETLGVVVTHMSMRPINDIGHQARSGDSAESYLIDAHGLFLTESRFVAGYSLTKYLDTQAAHALLTAQSGSAVYPDYRGIPVIGAYSQLTSYGFGVITEVDEAEALADTASLRNLIALITGVVALAAAAASFWIARRITIPLRSAVGMLQAIALGEGDLTTRLQVMTEDEVGDLATWFNRFMEKLNLMIAQTDQVAHSVAAASQRLSGAMDSQAPELASRALQAAMVTKGAVQPTAAGEEVLTTAVAIVEGLHAAVQNLISEKELVKRKSRLRSELLAQVSHDIRTPLNGISGMAYLLASTPLDSRQQHFLAALRRASDTLRELVNDVLDLSKLDAGRLVLAQQSLSIRQVVEDAVEFLVAEAREKGLDLSAVVDPDVPPWLTGDTVRLRQIVGNLVSNALHYTEAGSVRIAVHAEALGIRLTVTDTGTGIPQAFRDAIFDPFTRLDETTGMRPDGMGLGLTICRQLVEAMGGTLDVTAAQPKGSVFSAVLPLPTARSAPPSPRPESRRPQTALRILVAEDDAISLMFLQSLLEDQGHVVVAVTNGLAAVALAAGGDFDMALFDVQMADEGGIGACRRIREAEGTAARLPIIALTANVDKETATACFAAGMDLVMNKPLDVPTLFAALDTLGLGPTAAAPEA